MVYFSLFSFHRRGRVLSVRTDVGIIRRRDVPIKEQRILRRRRAKKHRSFGPSDAFVRFADLELNLSLLLIASAFDSGLDVLRSERPRNLQRSAEKVFLSPGVRC
jgi:hypothetical protein